MPGTRSISASPSRRSVGWLRVAALTCLFFAVLGRLGSAAENEPQAGPPVIDASLRADEIDPAIYFDLDSPTDPFRGIYSAFRERRARDMADPDRPRALEERPAEYVTAGRPWNALEEVFRWDWDAARASDPGGAAELQRAVRVRLAFDHPDFKILQVLLGPGAILPGHADAAPGAYHVIQGGARITVAGEALAVTPGASVKLDPYEVRRIEADLDESLKLLWFRWAPGGDQAYLASGYYLTGANQHVQPVEANLPDDVYFFGAPFELGPGPTPAAVQGPASCSFCESQSEALRRAKAKHPDRVGRYPKTARWSHESSVEWIRLDRLPPDSGFFWTGDVDRALPLASRIAEVFRIKAFFRAALPEGGYDFNVSYAVWGPRARYVQHSHATPEFYYIMTGPVEHWVGGVKHTAAPGNIYLHNSYTPHESRGVTDGLRYDVITGSWPPNGDRTMFDEAFFLVEPLPVQSGEAILPIDAPFH
jgi:quercetin dioxygenase-like cupin family protein